MNFMNDFDLAFAQRRFNVQQTPNRLGLALVVERLADWANENSDGWAYWPKPCRSAARAIALIESRTNRENTEQERVDATREEVTAALKPIRAFLTRQGVDDERKEYILRPARPLFEVV